MEEETSSICRLGDLYVKATWIQSDLFLTIIEGTKAWRGQIEEKDFKAIDAKTGGSMGKSIDMAKEAFSCQSENYSVTVDDDKLVWKKVGGKAKIKLQEININALNFIDAQKDIFEELINTNSDLRTKNRDFERRHRNLVDEMKKSKTMLKEFEKMKTEMEDRLYESFLPILNAKKAKIVELQRQLDLCRNISSLDEVKEEEEDYGSATDEDSEEDTDRGEKRKSSVDHLSSKKLDVGLDDSLDLLKDS